MLQIQRPSLLVIVILNLLPVWGVWQWGWTPFEVFYLFWVETLIIAFFNMIKIIFSEGKSLSPRLEESSNKYAGVHVDYGSNVLKALVYFGVRIFIFFFYLIFIVVFIGFLISKEGTRMHVLETMLFMNETFNLALLGFVLNQAVLLIFNFILNDDYKHTSASDFSAIFDGRQIIIHVAVVLGGVFSGFFGTVLSKDKDTNQMLVYIFVISVFCIAKIVYEIFRYKNINLKIQNRKSPTLG